MSNNHFWLVAAEADALYGGGVPADSHHTEAEAITAAKDKTITRGKVYEIFEVTRIGATTKPETVFHDQRLRPKQEPTTGQLDHPPRIQTRG